MHTTSVPHTEETPVKIARLVYILYLIGTLFAVTGIIGVVLAYLYRDDGPGWIESHFVFQIRTFWIGLVYLVSGALLFPFVVGYFIFLFWLAWLVIRSVRGLKQISERRPCRNPKRWLF